MPTYENFRRQLNTNPGSRTRGLQVSSPGLYGKPTSKKEDVQKWDQMFQDLQEKVKR